MGVAVFDHDAVVAGRLPEAVRRCPNDGVAVCRSWMFSSTEYAGFAAVLEDRGVHLVTGPEAYRRAHEVTGWYAAVGDLTPPGIITRSFSRAEFAAAFAELGGPLVLRDHVKSAKHHWAEACFVPEGVTLDDAWRIASRLYELRGSDATGGFVLRRHVALRRPELRTWWVNGRCVLVGPHPDEGSNAQVESVRDPRLGEFLDRVAASVTKLGLSFATVDVASDGDRWWLVEIGDGQVSDLGSAMDPTPLLTAVERLVV